MTKWAKLINYWKKIIIPYGWEFKHTAEPGLVRRAEVTINHTSHSAVMRCNDLLIPCEETVLHEYGHIFLADYNLAFDQAIKYIASIDEAKAETFVIWQHAELEQACNEFARLCLRVKAAGVREGHNANPVVRKKVKNG